MPKYLPKRLFFFILDGIKKNVPALNKEEPPQEITEELDHFYPVDDSIGVIQHLALSFYSGDDAGLKNSYNKLYSDLVMKMVRGKYDNNEELQISVIVPDKPTLAKVEKVNIAINTLAQFTGNYITPSSMATYNIMEANRTGLPMWIQDYFITLQNKNSNKPNIRLVEDRKRSRTNNDQANSLNKHLYKKYKGSQSKLIRSNLNFKGGNILFIGKYALVGADNLKGTNKTDFATQFQQITHIAPNNIIWLGNKKDIPKPDLSKTWEIECFNWMDKGSQQPIYHLDLFITPAGKDEFGRYRLLIGQPIYEGEQNLPIYKYTSAQIEAIVNQLESYPDLVIFRNPLPLTYADIFDDKKIQRRVWFFASYNNCLVQWDNKPENCCIWLPTYGSDFSNEKSGYEEATSQESKFGGNWTELKKYDLANEKLWQSLDFRVIRLTNYLPLAINRGAVRCISKVLYRNKLSA